MKKLLSNLKASFKGGTRFERSLKKILVNNNAEPNKKSIEKVINAILGKDEETTWQNAENLITNRLNNI